MKAKAAFKNNNQIKLCRKWIQTVQAERTNFL